MPIKPNLTAKCKPVADEENYQREPSVPQPLEPDAAFSTEAKAFRKLINSKRLRTTVLPPRIIRLAPSFLGRFPNAS
jgi:hypothetical protein